MWFNFILTTSGQTVKHKQQHRFLLSLQLNLGSLFRINKCRLHANSTASLHLRPCHRALWGLLPAKRDISNIWCFRITLSQSRGRECHGYLSLKASYLTVSLVNKLYAGYSVQQDANKEYEVYQADIFISRKRHFT